MALNTKVLVVVETRDGQVPVTDISDASVPQASTFSPKIFVMKERTENEVQQLFLGKYLTQKRTGSLKKSVYSDKNCFASKTNRVQSSLHRVKRFFHLLSNSSPPRRKTWLPTRNRISPL